jgi:hypothetical protein
MRFLIIIIALSAFNCASKHEKKAVTNPDPIEENQLNTIIEVVDESINIEKDFGILLEENASSSYSETKVFIKNIRKKINQNPISEDSLSKVFTDILVNKIIPYWYKTKWSFEGHTKIPKEGEIACGYFVSTTLRHMGININRYKLAQQNPLNEAKTLALDNPVINVSNESSIENIKAINEVLKEGIHFIGFGYNHVGYVLKKKEQLFLIHSNYINREGVIIEVIEESEVFTYFNEFHLVPISTNRKLLENWLSNTNIKVVTD